MAPQNDALRQRLLATFRVEADDLLTRIAAALEDPAAPDLESLYRCLHTLKGASRSVGLRAVETLCQESESVLHRKIEHRAALSEADHACLLEVHDAAARLIAAPEDSEPPKDLLGRIRALGRAGADAAVPTPASVPAPAPTKAPPGAPLAEGGERGLSSLRVATGTIDEFILKAEEMIGPALNARQRAQQAKQLLRTLAELRTIAPNQANWQKLDEPLRQAKALAAGLASDSHLLNQQVGAQRESLQALRLVPCGLVFEGFARMARELARDLGKTLRWELEGGDHELDRQVLERVKEPLIHLIRNAIDHGLEPPKERERRGKPATGTLRLTVVQLESGRYRITLSDDGRGIDPALLKGDPGARRGGKDGETLSGGALLEIVTRSGFTTKAEATDVSGRGLGLAIVRSVVSGLNGHMQIDNRPGAGLAVHLTVPTSISTVDGVHVRVAGHDLLVPLEQVERVIRLPRLTEADKEALVEIDGQPTEVTALSRFLGLAEAPTARASRENCIVLSVGGQRRGFFVDRIMGTGEAVVKPFAPPLERVAHIASAGLLGNGLTVLILRPHDLITVDPRTLAAAPRATDKAQGTAPAKRHTPARKTVLVVDDSPTSRILVEQTLIHAGYEVESADDGERAWSLLARRRFDAMVTDIEMPALDGIRLTERVRGDTRFKGLPVILLTGLNNEEHKRRGLDAGASAYLHKTSFDPEELLAVVESLL